VLLAIDDFGTGYSWLSYLRRFPIDIEHAEQAAHLATLGCQDGQGYHFARPLPPAAMTELLAKSLADGGFHLSTTVPVAESAAVP
jgi:EAL domain-containing protein (putative c-di-GMP-specific phosphodiesterase class I)